MASCHSRFYVYMIKIYLRKMEGYVMKELENVMSQLEKETKKIVIYDLSTQYGVAQGLCCYASQIWRSGIKFI